MNLNRFSMDWFSLKGRKAIVTGGNTGLGQAFSMALAKAGADVFIAGMIEETGVSREMLQAQGVNTGFLTIDITRPGACEQVMGRCLDTLGDVDILVNNAGICRLNPVLDFDRSDWDPMLAVNVTAAFEMSREAARHMIPKKSGKIINICSLFSYLGGRMSPAYAASKHALAGLTRAYCDELAEHNIQVNGIAPGYYATAITRETRNNPVSNQRVLDHIPAGRWGDPVDLMGAAVFLASRASDYVNGHILVVDGGYLVR
jgi:NAD(P)-dependent dehydrogenase (short-subunit alcohol dehydrogenase family)